MNPGVSNTYIFCFDGTGNDPGDAERHAVDRSVTNIAKLHAMFGGVFGDDKIEFSAPDGGEQRSFYYSGVGTYGGWLRRIFNKISGAPAGDVGRIIKAALSDVERNCKDNDRILIFGFSRGAAIARRFASLLSQKGKKIRFVGVFDTVAAMGFRDLKAESQPAKGVAHWLAIFGFRRGASIARNFIPLVSDLIPNLIKQGKKMRFSGVFDALAATGFPDLKPETRPASDVVFENGTMAASIEKAVHLLALDEDRLVLQPTLFNRDARVLEVWFPGAHNDVGGGYWRDGLSDVALRFMIERIKKECPNEVKILGGEEIDIVKLNGRGSEADICRDDLLINPLAHGELHSRTLTLVIAKKTLAARLVCVNENDKASDNLALVHCSVRERFGAVVGYRPIALRGRRYRILDESGQTSECEGIADLRRNA